MSLVLRIILIAVSLLTLIFVFVKIRKSQFYVSDTLFWLFFCVFLLVIGIFPQIPSFFANLIGFQAPSNFVFVAIIFLLLVKMFLMSVKLSRLEDKLSRLVSRQALDEGKTREAEKADAAE
ncbi:MAG: DUF2304 domain-containing protein [Clostridia bacterium]|nr:DUF2304 domain-containing protein [Clostridia bacterium]